MSTYYATFTDWKQAKSTTEELVNGGVSPDDLSLVLCINSAGKAGEITGRFDTVGDATSFVGRTDDPYSDREPADHEDLNLFTSAGESRLSPVDTSNRSTDVDTVDQMDDSQNESEFMISPHDGISNSAHERDDLALTTLTGFPTAPSNFSEEPFNPFAAAEQNADGLEIIQIPNVGLVIGGGALATAALDFGSCETASLTAHLTDEGVPEDIAQSFEKFFHAGQAILAVAVNPGDLNEAAVEEIATRHGALNGELYDAPRY